MRRARRTAIDVRIVGSFAWTKGHVVSGEPPEEEEPASCPILDLQLGPLDLDLLGLRVQLNQVDLNISAEPGPGNLLGNLLCAVVSLLDGVDLSGLLGDLLQQLLDALAELIGGIGGGAAPETA
jgi:hypothetical protein